MRFDWRTADYPGRNFDDRRHIGFIAQELKQVLPEVVARDTEGFHSVDYGKITAVLAEAVRQLEVRDNERKAQIEALSAQLEQRRALSARLEQLESRFAEDGSRAPTGRHARKRADAAP